MIPPLQVFMSSRSPEDDALLNEPCCSMVFQYHSQHEAIRNAVNHSLSGILPTISLLWLCCATRVAYAWAWGPYSTVGMEWKQAREASESSHQLMYRVVLPRSGTSQTSSGNGNGTHWHGVHANATGLGTVPVPLSTSTPHAAPYANATNMTALDTSCGLTSPLFTLQVSRANGNIFGNWWLKLSGNMVLFTSQKEKATSFGVNQGTRHLCIPQTGRLPLIATVETRLETSPLYFLSANFLQGYQPEYEPVACDGVAGNGSQLVCAQQRMTSWAGCGMQLVIGAGQNITHGQLNCSSIALSVY